MAARDSGRCRIALVEWLDAHGGVRTGWRDMAEIRKREPVVALSIGYLVAETKTTITICPHIVTDGEGNAEMGDGEISIPRSWVRKIKVLSRG